VTTLRKPAKFAGLVSVALAATSATVLFASQAAFATTPGDNGTVKVHDSTTPVTDYQNDPQDVCQFYLDGFGFDGAQSVTWYIDSWSPTTGNGPEVLSGSLTMDASGDGYTANQSLPNGHYKLFWNFTGENGDAKQKVFWVNCPGAEPTPTSTTPDGTSTGTPTPTPTCTCASTPPPTTPPPSPTQTPPSHVPEAPAPTAVTGSLPVTG
jgi:hypothetical protein